jgi:hypothetical protein
LEEGPSRGNSNSERIQESFRKAVDGYKKELNRVFVQKMDKKPWIR